jgi:hypothetical protein
MADFCVCGRLVVGRCTRCRAEICAEHAWNGPTPVEVWVVSPDRHDAPVHATALSNAVPWLPEGDWRSEQRNAMISAFDSLAPNGELLCKRCAGTALAALANAVPARAEPPADPFDRLVFLAERLPSPTSEQRDLEYRTARDICASLSDNGELKSEFARKLAHRLSQAGEAVAPCRRGHFYFAQKTTSGPGDSSKSSGRPEPRLDLPGVRYLDSVDADGHWWRCRQHSSGGGVEWQCSILDPDAKVIADGVAAYSDPTRRRRSNWRAYYVWLERERGLS